MTWRITWVRPELVIRAELGGWSRDDIVRQAAFKGMEPGRDPTAVVRETAVATTTAVRAAEAEAPPADPQDASADTIRKDRTSAPAPKTDRGAPPPSDSRDWRVTDDELAALDALGKEGVWRVGGDELKLTNLDKPLFEPREPDGGGPITKRELIRLLRAHRADDAATPRGPAAQPATVPQRRRRARASGRRTSPTPRRSG